MYTTISSYSYNGQAKVQPKKRKIRLNTRKLTRLVVRLAATAIFFLIVFAGFSLVQGNASSSYPAAPTAEERVIVVGSGDTLWKIAGSIKDEDQDIREVVFSIKKRNQLDNSTLQAGQSLIIPAGE